MKKRTEVLLIKAELLLWLCGKELYFGKVDELKKRYAFERDGAERAERSFFAKLRGNYEEKLGKEKAEAIKARLELERVEKFLVQAEERIPVLKARTEEDSFLYNEEIFEGEEKELFDWCEWMEQAHEMVVLLNRCIQEGRDARLSAYSGPGDREKNMLFQEDMHAFMKKVESFLVTVGRVRYLPGMRMKTIRGTRRNLLMNGRTLLFFRKDHPSVEIDILDFDLSELYGSWAVGDTLERKLKELKELEFLCHRIVEEKMTAGEDLLRKVKRNTCETSEKDIFGFEIKG